MTLDEPPSSTPKLRLVGIVWGVVGVVALIVGLVATLTAVAIFGGLALVAGVLVYSAQAYREASAARTRERMAGGPVSPMNAPAPVPDDVSPGSVPSGLEGRSGYRRRPWLRNEPHETEDLSGDGPSEDETAGDTDSSDESPSEADDGTGSSAGGGGGGQSS